MKVIKNTFMKERLIMDYTTLLPEVKESQEQEHQRLHSLYAVCQQVVDGRAARGKRYELATLLLVLVLAKLAGMKSLLGASEWIEHQEGLLREVLHLPWKRMPCANTYSYALAHLDSKPGECPIGGLVCATSERTAVRRRDRRESGCAQFT
jgi:hypothetical protein